MFMTKKRHEALMDAALAKSRTSGRLAAELMAERNEARKALRKIVAMETQHANATVKRMAAVARDALPG